MTALNHKIDFVAVFSVTNANPNGDPLNGNQPRASINGIGEISDVAIKHKIRNRLADEDLQVFVLEKDRSEEKSLADRWNKARTGDDGAEFKTDPAKAACREWIDVRAFGQVFAYKGTSGRKGDGVSIGIRGPVTLQPAFSVTPISIGQVQITKSINSETPKKKDGEAENPDKRSSDTMGTKYRVSGRAIYVTKGSISAHLAERTEFSDEDADRIKEALRTLFRNDESSARPAGSMEVLELVWFKHNNKDGQYSTAKVHRSVHVDADGKVTVDTSLIPGLQFEEIEGE